MVGVAVAVFVGVLVEVAVAVFVAVESRCAWVCSSE